MLSLWKQDASHATLSQGQPRISKSIGRRSIEVYIGGIARFSTG